MAIKKAQAGKKVGAEGRNRGSVAVGGTIRLDDEPKVKKVPAVSVKKAPVKMAPVKKVIKKVEKNLEGSQDAFKYSKGMPTVPVTKGKAKSGGSFPDLNKDGKVTKADILKGRGVIAKSGKSMKKCKGGC